VYIDGLDIEETGLDKELIKPAKFYNNFVDKTSIEPMREELAGKAGIYAFKHNESGKVYIGSSNNLWLRFSDHVKNRSSNVHLQRAFLKYGFNCFTFIVIKTLDNTIFSKEELNTKLIELEQVF